MNALAFRWRARPVPVAAPLLAAGEVDETRLFSQEQGELLAARGLVYMTDLQLDRERFGTIIAADHAQAVKIAGERGHGEKIIGRMGQSYLRNLKMRLLERR